MTAAPQNLGFLSVVEESSGFVGGYLVTNLWGRPLEFRLSSAVQPNKVQQILYGDSLRGYLSGEVIGKTLIEKATTTVGYVFVDQPSALEVRPHVAFPVGLWHCIMDPEQSLPGLLVHDRLYCHSQHSDDARVLKSLIEQLGPFDLSEPFARIREAMQEARKMGVTMRRAA